MSSFERHAHLLGFLARQAVQERGYAFATLVVVTIGVLSTAQVLGLRFTLYGVLQRWHAWAVEATG